MLIKRNDLVFQPMQAGSGYLFSGEDCSSQKFILISFEKLLRKDTQLGSGSGESGVCWWILIKNKLKVLIESFL